MKNKTVKVLKKVDGFISQLDASAAALDRQAVDMEGKSNKVWKGYGAFMDRCTKLRRQLDKLIAELELVVQKKYELNREKVRLLEVKQTSLLEEKERAIRVSEKLKEIVK